MIKKMKTEKGSTTIEAVIAFTGFLFVIFTILGLVNLCRAQMIVSAAVDTAAKELSQYAYFYQVSGLKEFDDKITDNADTGKKHVNQVIGTVDSLFETLGNVAKNSAEDAAHLADATQKGELDIDDLIKVIRETGNDISELDNAIISVSNAMQSIGNDPLLYMRSIVAIAGQQGANIAKRALAAVLGKMFVQKHFGDTPEEIKATLESLGIEGGLDSMDFSMSKMFIDGSQDIEIVVVYKVKLFQFLEWMPMEATVYKRAICRAWLGGDADSPPKSSGTQQSTAPSETMQPQETTGQDD